MTLIERRQLILLRLVPSLLVALPAPFASREVMFSFAADRLFAACVWFAPGVADPWRVYRLKHRGMQSQSARPIPNTSLKQKWKFAFVHDSLLQKHPL